MDTRIDSSHSAPARRSAAPASRRDEAPEGDELARYLDALAREDAYQMEEVLGGADGATVTELVCFVGARGASLGPMVRKRIPLESGVGTAYETLFALQRAGRRFRHLPRIVECYKTAADLVVVSEYVPGESLQHFAAHAFADLTRGDPVGFARRVFPAICDAVAELHEAADPPVVHRDLKPQNIIVAPEGLFLIDLGIARQVRAHADRDTVRFGTRAYAPPEQYGFGQTDPRSDIYALGQLLVFCATGAEPTGHRDAGELACVMDARLAPLAARATALDPSARFTSVRELKEAFLRAAGERGVARDASAVSPTASAGAVPLRTGVASPRATSAPTHATAMRVPAPRAATPAAAVRREWGGVVEALGEVPRFFGRVPMAAGVLWDGLVIVFVVLLCAGCVNAVLHPTPADAMLPRWFLALEYPLMLGSWFMGVGYLLLDKRLLKRHFPFFARRRTADDALAVALIAACTFVVTVIARMVVAG